MLQLIDFINTHNDWEKLLTQKPYCIKINRKDNFIMFNYSQIDSDFYNSIVKECRGLILDINFNPVCIPFYKFGNYGEGYVDIIDWDSAKVQEKIDGSLIKLWNYKGVWHISTGGNIDAHDARGKDNTPICDKYESFYDLFITAAHNNNLDINKLNPNYTWMFELISPYTRVTVPYDKLDIYHIGTRNNITLEECNINIGIKKPHEYQFNTLNDCLENAKKLPFIKEGYVVVDKYWHRNKVKSSAWMVAHYIKNNGVITDKRIIEMIKINECDEFLSYYPEYENLFKKVKYKIHNIISYLNSTEEKIKDSHYFKDKREFAKFACKTKYPDYFFMLYDNKVKNPREWLWNKSNRKIEQLINSNYMKEM